MRMFLLRRASIYRPGHWADDDYDVYDGERNVGRIFWAEAGHPGDAVDVDETSDTDFPD